MSGIKYTFYRGMVIQEAGQPGRIVLVGRHPQGQGRGTFPYVFDFVGGKRAEGMAELIFADQATGQMLMKWNFIEIEDDVGEGCLRYLNRLSDFLFVLGRWTAKKQGIAETLWQKPT